MEFVLCLAVEERGSQVGLRVIPDEPDGRVIHVIMVVRYALGTLLVNR